MKRKNVLLICFLLTVIVPLSQSDVLAQKRGKLTPEEFEAMMKAIGAPIPGSVEFELSIMQPHEVDFEKAKRAHEAKLDWELRTNKNVLFYAKLFVEGSVDGSLDFSMEQLNAITQILQKMDVEIEKSELRHKNDHNPERAIAVARTGIEGRATLEIANRLVKRQLIMISEWDPRRLGLSKLVTDTGVGDIVKISDAKKQRIKERSHALSKKIEAFIKEVSKESKDIVLDELNDGTVELLKRHFPNEVRPYANSLHQLAGQLRYQELDKPNDLKRKNGGSK